MATSVVPAAVTALHAALSAALTGVQVYDGPPTTNEPSEYVCVGHDPAGGDAAVDANQAPAALGNRSREETFEIACGLSAWTGGDDLAAMRTRAYELLAEVEDVLRTNITLTGTVRWAQLAGHTLRQGQTQSGAVAWLSFRVTCNARI